MNRTKPRPIARPIDAPPPWSLPEIVLQSVRALSLDPYAPPDLPAVYRLAWARHPSLTLGDFHDAVRALHAGGRLRLHPFTRALATLPDRANAIFLDGEVMFWISEERGPAA